jgi:hypothetical protein
MPQQRLCYDNEGLGCEVLPLVVIVLKDGSFRKGQVGGGRCAIKVQRVRPKVISCQPKNLRALGSHEGMGLLGRCLFRILAT